ncbi:hypothetical protein MBLNU230_g4008t1 [Neophaeotheca triangularis]
MAGEQPLEPSSSNPNHDEDIKNGNAPDRPTGPHDQVGHIEDPYIFTTVRYDPRLADSSANTAASCGAPSPIYMLEHHWTRLRIASWSTRPRESEETPAIQTPAKLLQALLTAIDRYIVQTDNPESHRDDCLRVKLRRYVTGRMTIEIGTTARLPLTTLFPSRLYFADGQDGPQTEWRCVVDSQPTEANEATMFKTSDRLAYTRAREDAGIDSLLAPKEVLLWTAEGKVLDGSINTPYFFRGGRWVTQAGDWAGLQGTTRKWALNQGLVVEDAVSVGDVRGGETIWFSNAVKGFFPAIVVAREEKA